MGTSAQTSAGFDREPDKAESQRMAQEMLNLDDAVVSVGVVNHLGFLMACVVREQYARRISFSNEEWEESAQRAATIMAAVKGEDKVHSQIESIVLVRKEFKSLIMWIPHYATILKVILVRSADAAQVTDKIRANFGLDS